MKTLILLMLISFPVNADEWSREDVQLEIVYNVLLVVDLGQTLNISKNCDTYYELNQLLGRCPNQDDVYKYFIVNGVLHGLISNYLSADNRQLWQYVTIGYQTGVVGRNWQLGLSMDF